MELHSPGRHQGARQVRAAGALCARHDARVGEDRAAASCCPAVSIADFGTRRRHGFLWQDWCVQAMIEGLGAAFLGTSNCLIAMRREVEAIGTNAHELPMVYCRARRQRPRAGRGALQGAGRLAAGLRRQPARHAAGHLRLARFPGARARLGDELDRHPHRFRRSDRRRRDRHRLVAAPRAGPAPEAADLLRRPRRRRHRAHPPPFPRPRAHRLRLGHAAHQRFPRARARRRASIPSPSSAR